MSEHSKIDLAGARRFEVRVAEIVAGGVCVGDATFAAQRLAPDDYANWVNIGGKFAASAGVPAVAQAAEPVTPQFAALVQAQEAKGLTRGAAISAVVKTAPGSYLAWKHAGCPEIESVAQPTFATFEAAANHFRKQGNSRIRSLELAVKIPGLHNDFKARAPHKLWDDDVTEGVANAFGPDGLPILKGVNA